MDNLAKASPGDRADAFAVSANVRGIGAGLLEKDFWVCWTLRRLYSLQNVPGILFKGGTSLSKVFNAIERFSEDIDLSLDRAAFGFGNEKDPSKAPSRKQRDRRLEDLSEQCRLFVHGTLLGQLRNGFSQALGTNSGWSLEAAEDDPDEQTLLFAYRPAVMGLSAYIRPMVRMEFGARSDHWPAVDAEVVPFVAQDVPSSCTFPSTRVHALAGERTFWEKVTALHAWHQQPVRILSDRRSRHYYDVARLYQQEIGQRAIGDIQLLEAVARHKMSFFPSTAAHYELARPGTLRVSPPPEQIDGLRRDYEGMAEMFFGTCPPFSDVLATLAEIQDVANRT